MRFSGQREVKKTKIEIIPMIDTMFFLLVFFILASLNIIDLRGLNLDLPPSILKNNPVRDPRDVKLEMAIDKDGNKVITPGNIQVKRGKPATKDLLQVVQGQLNRAPSAADLKEITITISPDESTWHQWVIEAVDDARGAKIEKFQIR